MSRTTHLIAAAAALLLAAAIPSQSLIRILGTLRETKQGFHLDEVDMALVATNVDLHRFAGRVTELTGTIRADAVPPVFDVATAEQATRWFQTSGDTRVGRQLQVRIDVPDIGRWYLYFAAGSGMMPLESYMPYGSGTLWLEPSTLDTLGLGDMVQTWQDRLTVPNSPDLIGAVVWLQGAVHIEPGPLLFLNANRITLLP